MRENKYLAGFVILGMVAVMATIFWASSKAQAIPVFARKYRTSCTTCHIGFPKLTSFGAVLYGNNENPHGEMEPDRVNYVSWFGEADWVIFPWMVAAFRWEEVDPDSGLADTKRAVGSLITYPRANIRLVFEGRFGVHSDNADKYLALLDYVF